MYLPYLKKDHEIEKVTDLIGVLPIFAREQVPNQQLNDLKLILCTQVCSTKAL